MTTKAELEAQVADLEDALEDSEAALEKSESDPKTALEALNAAEASLRECFEAARADRKMIDEEYALGALARLRNQL